VFPSTVLAKKNHHKHHHKHHKHDHHNSHHHNEHYHNDRHRDVVIVNEHHHSYHESRLPEIATFAVIAGVTYAVVNNTFYKKSGNEYRSVQQPAYR